MSERLGSGLAGRSVFVTGHTGFKGSWLTIWLARLGARVTGYALAPPTTPSLFVAADVGSLLAAHHEADLRDRPRLAAAVAQADPDVIFHLAAQTRVLEGYREPVETFSVNVIGTAILLDVIRERGKPCAVVAISSDKCYENDESGKAFVESDPLGGADPYSASKGAMEIVLGAYRSSYFDPSVHERHRIGLASGRAGNVIGGGDWTEDAVIPDTVRALVAGRPVDLRQPAAIRPWQHVLEPLSGYILLGERLLGPAAPEVSGPWNFGPEGQDDASVGKLVAGFLDRWGSGSSRDLSGAESPHEAGILRLSPARARERLGWRPRWHLETAIERTADWYREVLAERSTARRRCEVDIETYEASAIEPAEAAS